jgi:hypothetical protein
MLNRPQSADGVLPAMDQDADSAWRSALDASAKAGGPGGLTGPFEFNDP